MQIAVLDGQGHNQTTDEHHVGLLHVSHRHRTGAHDAEQGEEDDRNQTGHGQRKGFRHPVKRHDEDHVASQSFLIIFFISALDHLLLMEKAPYKLNTLLLLLFKLKF